MIPLSGFLPDIDPVTPGIITSCSDIIPTRKGYEGAPSLIDTTVDALADVCLGAAALITLDGTARTIAGTDTKLYEIAGTAWTDVSRAGDYSTGDIRWRFGVMGDTILATNAIDVLQYSTSGDFADVTDAPKAKYMDVAAGFVMLGWTNESTYGDQSDRWWCSAFQDYSDWTPDTATECTTGRVVDSPGPIRGIKAFGSQFVMYKDKAVFLGEYVSAPDVFRWTRIPGEIGCTSQEAIISITTAHFFIGQDNFYAFDGNSITPIGDGIKEWFFANLNNSYRHLIQGMHDRRNSRIWWFFPKSSSTSLNAAVIYNYATQRWGYAEYAIECPLEYVSGGITWDDLGTIAPTWNEFPNVAYDSPFWTATEQLPVVFNTTHKMRSLTGISAGGTLKLGIFGDDTQRSVVTRVRPHFTKSPSTGTMTNYSSETDGVSMTTGTTTTLSNGKFDVLKSARWHQFEFTYGGNFEITGNTFITVQDGLE